MFTAAATVAVALGSTLSAAAVPAAAAGLQESIATAEDPSHQGRSAAMAAALQQRIIAEPDFRRWFIDHIRTRVASEPEFRASFTDLVQRRHATDPSFREIWTAGIRAGNDALLANAGPSPWTGNPIPHPRGGYISPNVTQWASIALSVMAEHNVDPHYLPGILAQIQQESSGNPNAVNGWDINARYGYASMGLLQVIAPTYRSFARPGYTGELTHVSVGGRWQQFQSPWQTRPYTNLWAALNYVIHRYGYQKFTSWNNGLNQGYSLDQAEHAALAAFSAPTDLPVVVPDPPLEPLPVPAGEVPTDNTPSGTEPANAASAE